MAEQDNTLTKWYEEPPDDPRFPGIAYRQGGSGSWRPVLRGTAVHVHTILIACFLWGQTREEIARNYELPVHQISEALAFIDAHREEVAAFVAADVCFTEVQREG